METAGAEVVPLGFFVAAAAAGAAVALVSGARRFLAERGVRGVRETCASPSAGFSSSAPGRDRVLMLSRALGFS